MNNIAIPFNDVFFYGLTMRSRDSFDIRSDIFSNILMRYLTSLKPVKNRLYRVADNCRYEYNYSFVPTKTINWRVLKNSRVVEDVEQMSDGKYCLNYYDDNGNDVNRVIFSNQHKWTKTNYYNSIYGESLVCSLVPKELNGETAILQYITGNPYPVTLYCCPMPSNTEVLQSVLSRVPEPEVTALTNYGILYFACEETLKMFKQVLTEEERRYLDANKPAVYNTDEDVAGGFCFDVSSFDSTKNLESSFDLMSADELTEDGFDILSDVKVEEFVILPEQTDEISEDINSDNDASSEEYSIDKEISDAIRIISESTNLNIDESIVFANDESVSEESSIDNETVLKESVAEEESVSLEEEVSEEDTSINDNIPEVIAITSDDDVYENIIETEDEEVVEDTTDPQTFADINITDSGLGLLDMDDEAIDDYVSMLIDSILLDAKSTAADYLLDKDDEFGDNKPDGAELTPQLIVGENYVSDNTPDASIESNGVEYYYYGQLDENHGRFGRGKTLMADGKTAYEGDYLNDMRHGVGSFYFKDGGLCYWGEWEKNNRNGFGIGISSETGVAHIGTWNDNKPVGIGARFDNNGNFMYLDSSCEKINGGIRITGFTEKSVFVEIWDEKTLKILKKEIFIEDLFN